MLVCCLSGGAWQRFITFIFSQSKFEVCETSKRCSQVRTWLEKGQISKERFGGHKHRGEIESMVIDEVDS